MMDGMVALPLIWGNGWIECIRIIRKYVLLSVNMVPAQVFTINKIRWLKLYQPVGGILKTGRRIMENNLFPSLCMGELCLEYV